MAVTYGFYNSLNGDRTYNAEQMSAIFDGIITDGVFSTIGDALMTVAGTGMQVIVKTGKCWFNSTWTLNDAAMTLAIDTADVSLTRIDAVVVEIDSGVSTRENSIKILKGTPSANPAKPTLASDEDLHQYALAYVTVGAGITSITASNIQVNVGQSTCPFITSVLQQTSITDLFNAWDGEFNTWFENLQAQMEGDVATNLQNQIDQLNSKDVVNCTVATPKEAYDGAATNKLIPPASIANTIDKIGDVRFSTRASMGSAYLIANGSSFNTSEYPELSSYLYPSRDMLNMSGVSDYTSTVGLVYTKDLQYYLQSLSGYYSSAARLSNNATTYTTITLPKSMDIRNMVLIVNDNSSNRYFLKPYDYGDECSINEIDPATLSVISHGQLSTAAPNYIRSFFHAFGYWYYCGSNTRPSESSRGQLLYYASSLSDLIASPLNVNKGASSSEYWIHNGRILSNGYIAGLSNNNSKYVKIYTSHSNILNETYRDFATDDGGSLGFFVIGNMIYRITAYVSSNSATINVYIADGTSTSPTTTVLTLPNQQGSRRCVTYFNGEAIYILNYSKELYKVTGTSMTKIGTLSGQTNQILVTVSNSTGNYYWENGVGLYVDESNQQLFYVDENGYVVGSYYDKLPTISGPSGTTAFIKAKEVG